MQTSAEKHYIFCTTHCTLRLQCGAICFQLQYNCAQDAFYAACAVSADAYLKREKKWKNKVNSNWGFTFENNGFNYAKAHTLYELFDSPFAIPAKMRN